MEFIRGSYYTQNAAYNVSPLSRLPRYTPPFGKLLFLLTNLIKVFWSDQIHYIFSHDPIPSALMYGSKTITIPPISVQLAFLDFNVTLDLK